jgi:hypothetical protein
MLGAKLKVEVAASLVVIEISHVVLSGMDVHVVAQRCRKLAIPIPHRSPGRHVEGGSFAEIFVGRSATRWLRLYG